jgi:hypothetical protein
MRRGIQLALLLLATALLAQQAPAPRVIEITATKDSRYLIDGKENPHLTFKAGEPLELRVTAFRAKTWGRDGSVHGLAMLRAKDRRRVPGWNFFLSEGRQVLHVNAPAEPGEYVILCTVICSEGHEQMTMKVTVEP